MSRLERASHVIWHCQYHLVWEPTYRLNVRVDHVHLLVKVPPRLSI
jgi:putative transposase